MLRNKTLQQSHCKTLALGLYRTTASAASGGTSGTDGPASAPNDAAFPLLVTLPAAQVRSKPLILMPDVVDQHASLGIDIAQALYRGAVGADVVRQRTDPTLVFHMERMMRFIMRIVIVALQLLLITEVLVDIIGKEFSGFPNLVAPAACMARIQQIIDRVEQCTVLGVDQFIAGLQIGCNTVLLNIFPGRRSYGW